MNGKHVKAVRTLFRLILVATLITINTGCFSKVLTSDEIQSQIEEAYEYFALPEFPNMAVNDLLFPVYFVSTPEEFNNIRKYKDRSFIITNDIDMSSIENFDPIGTKNDPFRGEVTSACVYTYGGDHCGAPICIGTPSCHCMEGYNVKDYHKHPFRTISNINIEISDENYTEYAGVFGYTDKSDVTYYIEGFKKIRGWKHKIPFVNRNKTVNLVFENVNINVTSTKPVVVGGVFGRVDIHKRTYIVNSYIRGNYIVGGKAGINDGNDGVSNLYDHAGSLFNHVEITPVNNSSIIGGTFGVSIFDNINSDGGRFINYNDIYVNQNKFSSTVLVGGLAGKVEYTRDNCTLGFSGVSFGNFYTNDAITGLLFGYANAKDTRYCTLERNNYYTYTDFNGFYVTSAYHSLPIINHLYHENNCEIEISEKYAQMLNADEELPSSISSSFMFVSNIDGYDYPILRDYYLFIDYEQKLLPPIREYLSNREN